MSLRTFSIALTKNCYKRKCKLIRMFSNVTSSINFSSILFIYLFILKWFYSINFLIFSWEALIMKRRFSRKVIEPRFDLENLIVWFQSVVFTVNLQLYIFSVDFLKFISFFVNTYIYNLFIIFHVCVLMIWHVTSLCLLVYKKHICLCENVFYVHVDKSI